MSAKQNRQTFHLKFGSRTENLEHARQFVANIARRHGFTADDVAKIELAVDEACTNIIKHAYAFDPERSISVTVTLTDSDSDRQKLVILIRDTGASFDHTKYIDPDMNEYFKKYRVGGLGIMLMKKLMDEVFYNVQPGHPNEVTLVKYLPTH